MSSNASLHHTSDYHLLLLNLGKLLLKILFFVIFSTKTYQGYSLEQPWSGNSIGYKKKQHNHLTLVAAYTQDMFSKMFVTYVGNVLKFRTHYSVPFWPKFSNCSFKYLVEWPTV